MADKIIINSDGGSRGNPGPGAIGAVIRNEEGEPLEKISEYIGKTTNNVAEYKALSKALQLASSHTSGEVSVYLDSELLVKQLTGKYRVKSKDLLPLFKEIKSIESNFDSVTYKHVSRWNKYQKEADALVNEALDKK